MASVMGAKAIHLVTNGGIEEKPHARVFIARGSSGNSYTVVFGTKPTGSDPRYECSCPAHGPCYHGEAAILFMAREREAVSA